MDALRAVLQVNEAIVYSVYGQVFFSLGLVVALHSRRHSQLELARQLTWLAAFGLSHGLYEWAHVFIPIQEAYLPGEFIDVLWAARGLLLPISFFFLGQFGSLVAFSTNRGRLMARATFVLLLLAWAAWVISGNELLDRRNLPEAQSWARRTVGLPAATLAALGMMRQARSVAASGLSSIARDFRVAAAAFAAYAFLAGFVGAPQDPLSAQWPVYRITVELFGLPAPVLRSIAGLGMVLGIVRGLRIFEVETDRLLEAAERMRLEAAERSRGAMESMATAVSGHQAQDDMLQGALRELLTLVGARSGWLTLADPAIGRVELRASLGLTPEAAATVCHPKNGCPCRAATLETETFALPSSSRCGLWPSLDAAAWTVVPLRAHGKVVGVIHLIDGETRAEMLALLTSLGKQLGLAIENAELAREVARKEAARAHLLRQVITAQEEERRRVARELHDQTGQSLTAVIMSLGAAGEQVARSPRKVAAMLEEARDIAVQALEATRTMIMGLRPAALDDLGLVPALRRLAEDLSRKDGVAISVEGSGLPHRLSPDVEVVLFRILQEGLSNVARHARASRARVAFDCGESYVRAIVQDDGVGFDVGEATAHMESGRGLGLIGMMERAELVGGSVELRANPGKGASVIVHIPLAPGEGRKYASVDSR